MNVLHIEAVVAPYFLSAKFQNERENEFDKLVDQWNNVEYLENFFSENEISISGRFFNINTVESAVQKTIRDAGYFFDVLDRILERDDSSTQLKRIFKPLDKKALQTLVHERNKSYCGKEKSWLRLYAIRLGYIFIVSGGGIKLTQTMNESTHLQKELQKMNRLIEYLRSEKIFKDDDYQFIDFGV